MTPEDAQTIVAIAALAAQADGQQDDTERGRIGEMASGLGLSDASASEAIKMAASLGVPASLARLTEHLSDDAARRAAYDTAVSVCYADGWVNPSEAQFLRALAAALKIDADPINQQAAAVHTEVQQAPLAAAPFASASAAAAAAVAGSAAAAMGTANATPVTPTPTAPLTSAPAATTAASTPSGDIDNFILDQAMLSAALELLPDRLANLGILPLQLRMAKEIGERHGQRMDASQVKDLAAIFGIGAAAQIMEKVVRGMLGGVVGRIGGGMLGGMLGGLAGGATGFAAGAAVTFTTTYAMGHAAEQYYAQGRTLSTSDMKALFERFKGEAATVFPKVEARIKELAGSGKIGDVLRSAPRTA
jgi:tellurite resistance protein